MKNVIFLMMTSVIPYLLSCTQDEDHGRSSFVGDDGMTVTMLGDGMLRVDSRLSPGCNIMYEFRKCMFNELFTFSRVGLYPDRTYLSLSDFLSPPLSSINTATSDNIGPVDIAAGGWAGGSHSWRESHKIRTARTDSVTITADGVPLALRQGDMMTAGEVEIRVSNTIFNPVIHPDSGSSSLSVPLCYETVKYLVEGNSVTVAVSHEFVNEEPVMVNSYYGMQTNMTPVHEILTPGGPDGFFRHISPSMRFDKVDYPDFRLFVQRTSTRPVRYQALWLLPVGLGTHQDLWDDSPVFIRSNEKSYHVLVKDRQRHAGMTCRWLGVYSWFNEPIVAEEPLFAYGLKAFERDIVIVCASAPGNYTVTLPDRYAMRPFTVMDNNADMSIDANITFGDIRFRADRQGFFALGFGDDNDDITIDSCANRFLREI